MKNCVHIKEKVWYGIRLYGLLRTLVNREVDYILDDRVDEIDSVLMLRDRLMKEIAVTEASIRGLHDEINTDLSAGEECKGEADRLVGSLRSASSDTMEMINGSRAALSRAKSGILAELQTQSARSKAVANYTMISKMVLHK